MRGVIVGVLLIVLGLITYVYGMNLAKPEDPLSGVYGAVIGVFLGIAGLLVLVSNVFRGSLLSPT
jgi:Mg2+ and Co2+ transporter CorA